MSAISTVVADVSAAIAEIDAALTVITPQNEGLKDYARLDLQEDTRREIQEAIGDYDRRVQLLHAAKLAYQTLADQAVAAVQALVNDGHPDLPQRQISPAAVADLQAREEAIQAARALFVQQATQINPTAGAAEPKSPIIR